MLLPLQTVPTGINDLYWAGGIVAVLVIAYFYYQKLLADRAKRKRANHDPRSHIVNDSNYNIAHDGIDGHRSEVASERDAEVIIGKMKSTDTIPSRKEFHELRKETKALRD